MAKKQISLDDILDEYGNATKRSHASDAKLDEILGVKTAEKPKPAAEKKTGTAGQPPVTKPAIRKQPAASHRGRPANAYKPSDIKKPEVSFMHSVAAIEAAQRAKMHPNTETAEKSAGYDTVVRTRTAAEEEAYQPKIRKMADSTRAKEMREKKRFRRNKPEYTYDRETPAEKAIRGAKAAQPPKEEPKRKFRIVVEDLQKQPPDSVPKPFLEPHYAPQEPIPYLQKAEKTSIDLSAKPPEDPAELDVRIKTERKVIPGQPKRVRDPETQEDIKEIRRDIYSLKGKLFFRVLFLFLMAFLSAFLALAEQYGIPVPDLFRSSVSPKGYLVVQLLLGLLGGACSVSVLQNGMKKLFQLRADCDTMAALPFLSAFLSALLTLGHPEMLRMGMVHVYIPVALVTLFCNGIGKLLIVSRAARNYDLVYGKFDRHAILCVENEKRAESLTRGTIGDFPILAAMKKTDNLTDFLRYTYSSDLADKFCRIAAPISLGIALVASVFIATLRRGQLESPLCFAISAFAMCFSACACMSVTLLANIPLHKGTQKYVKNQGAMLGYQSVDDFFDVNSVMVDAGTLFPKGTVTLSAIKIFSDTKIDDAILDAASLTQRAGSILQDLFKDAIEGKSNMLRKVENFSYEESLGLCGWIHNKRVLFGSRDLMMGHNIEGMPTKTKETEFTGGTKDALYLSVSGNLAAMFVVDIQAHNSVKFWLRELEHSGVCLLLRTNDALISLNRISNLFDISTEMVKIIPARMHAEFDAETAPAKKVSASMSCSGKFSGMAQLLLGAKAIKSAATLGVILQAAAACLGMVIALVYLLMQAYTDLSANMFLIYNLIWTGVTVLLVGSKRV